MHSLIKWPGGKAQEIRHIEHMIPPFARYIEPFFGGGAMFFYLQPQVALINDVSASLMDFYRLVQAQDAEFHACLTAYQRLFSALIAGCEARHGQIHQLYRSAKEGGLTKAEVKERTLNIAADISQQIRTPDTQFLLLNRARFDEYLGSAAADKIMRTVKNDLKTPFNEEDLRENLITGFTSGFYLYFRSVYNDIQLGRVTDTSRGYNMANFYFIREYCYGSMFRYNSDGEFNIPYGGMSYNRKDFKGKIDHIFSDEVARLFRNTHISCADFADFIEHAQLTPNDFMFVDPPYDSDFSDYEGRDFTAQDHRRLAEVLRNTQAQFIMVIKNTDFIYSLYEGDFQIFNFDKTYVYNVRSRNDRQTEHLIITNIPV